MIITQMRICKGVTSVLIIVINAQMKLSVSNVEAIIILMMKILVHSVIHLVVGVLGQVLVIVLLVLTIMKHSLMAIVLVLINII